MSRDSRTKLPPHPGSRDRPRDGRAAVPRPGAAREGWKGWDEYAPFYDWENARTLGRRDVKFWTEIARQARGPVLELGCGTGRVSWPLVRAGVDLVGIERSEAMLARALEVESVRLATSPKSGTSAHARFLRGDIRALPFTDGSFAMVIAPYGVVQSLIRPRDLAATLRSLARVIRPGGLVGIDLVPDVPSWREYRNKVQMRGRSGGAHLTLVESVRQDRRRRLTIFEQCYVERRGQEMREHRFELTFRTLTVPGMARELSRAGFSVTAVLGDYDGRPLDSRLDARANVWIILAKKG